MTAARTATPATGAGLPGGEVVRRLPGVLESAHAARDFIRAVLAGAAPAVADDAELCVSELVANAVAYTRSGRPGGWVTVAVQAGPGAVLVRVRDQGSHGGPALASDVLSLAEHGRGLRIVAALADEWGSHPDGAGRVTWFRLEERRLFCPESLAAGRSAYCDPAACCRPVPPGAVL